MLKNILSLEELRFIPNHCRTREDVLLWLITNEYDLCIDEEKVVIKKVFQSFKKEELLYLLLLVIEYEISEILTEGSNIERKDIFLKTIVKNNKNFDRYIKYKQSNKKMILRLEECLEFDWNKKDFIKIIKDCINIDNYIRPIFLQKISSLMKINEVYNIYENFKTIENILFDENKRESNWLVFFNNYWNNLDDSVILSYIENSNIHILKIYNKIIQKDKKERIIRIIKNGLKNENRKELKAKKIIIVIESLKLYNEIYKDEAIFNFINNVLIKNKEDDRCEYVVDFTSIDWIFNSCYEDLNKKISKENIKLLNLENFNNSYTGTKREIKKIKCLKLGLHNIKNLIDSLKEVFPVCENKLRFNSKYENNAIISIVLEGACEQEEVFIYKILKHLLENLDKESEEVKEDIQKEVELYIMNLKIKKQDKKNKLIKF